MVSTKANDSHTIGGFYGVDGKKLQRQFRDYLSEFKQWEERPHAKEWLIFPENIGPYLSIDETALSKGELYTIITNKKAKGKKGSIVAIFSGTKVGPIIEQLLKISAKKRAKVKEITLDMANSMKTIAKQCFPKAIQVTDRFHVQKLALEALQDIRIKHRWDAIDRENQQIKQARAKNGTFVPKEFSNGDTRKQLLVRSRYLGWFALGTEAASPQHRKGYSRGPDRRRRERPKNKIVVHMLYRNKKSKTEILDFPLFT